MRQLWIALLMAGLVLTAHAQDGGLSADDVDIIAQVDVFGVEQQVAAGVITNNTENAYTDVQVFAEVYDADDEIIGEGFGFLVNQCGKNTPLGFALQPGVSQRFIVPLEFYGDGTDIERIDFFPQGQAVPAEAAAGTDRVPGIIPVTRREIAGLEWQVITPENAEGADNEAEAEPITTLLYGEGCYRDVFTTYDWYEYDPATDTDRKSVV
jgi:hypothetical protein